MYYYFYVGIIVVTKLCTVVYGKHDCVWWGKPCFSRA